MDNASYHTKMLFQACKLGVESTVKALLENGVNCNVSSKDSSMLTPLHVAAKGGKVACVKLLLDAGADIHALDDGTHFKMTPLDMVVKSLFDLLGSHIQRSIRILAYWRYPKASQALRYLISAGVVDDLLISENAVLSSDLRPKLEIIDLLVRKGAKFDILIHAAKFLPTGTFTSILWCLLESLGLDVNVSDAMGYTPLHFVVSKCSHEHVQFLIDKGANVNAVTHDYFSPLHSALYHGASDKIVKLLVWKGADVNFVCHGTYMRNPFLKALQRGDKLFARALAESGADPFILNHRTGYTPLMYLLEDRPVNLQLVKFFVENGADVCAKEPAQGFTSLHTVAANLDKFPNSLEIMKLLLKYAPFVDVLDSSGCTPLMRAVMKESFVMLRIVKLLVKKGADILIKEPMRGFTALHFVAEHYCSLSKGLEVMEFLSKSVSNVDVLDASGCTPLTRAVFKDSSSLLPVIKLLLEKGANPNIKGYECKSALYFAICFSNAPVLSLFMEFEVEFDWEELANHRIFEGRSHKWGYNEEHQSSARQLYCREDIILERRNFLKQFVRVMPLLLDENSFDRVVYVLHELLRSSSTEQRCFSCATSATAVVFNEMENYLLRSKSLKEEVCESDLKSILAYRLPLQGSYHEAWKTELSMMKCDSVGDSITLWDILKTDVYDLATWLRREDLCYSLTENYLAQLPSKYQIFGDTLRKHFQKGLTRRSLLNEATSTVNFLFSQNLFVDHINIGRSNFASLPTLITDKILQLLSNGDLQTLVLAQYHITSEHIKKAKDCWRQKLMGLLISNIN